MKVHSRKKAYREMIRKFMRDGLINDASGKFVPRNHVPDSSMKRDFYNRGK